MEPELTIPKLRLKYVCMYEYTKGYALPADIFATVDLDDKVSKALYDLWVLNNHSDKRMGDTKACYIHVGRRTS